MKYIIYKTTNKLDGKYYIGCHSTNNINDGYLGSGKHLTRAIKKYGRENFKFEILHIVTSQIEMFNLERQLVNEELVKDPMTYNLKIGGSGGNPGIVGAFKGKKHSEETKEKIRFAALHQITTDQKRQKLSENNWSKKDPQAQRIHASKINRDRPKSESQRQKLSEWQTGKKLVNNGITSCWVKRNDVPILISQGWMLGKIKK
jgi:group I intron endonuclease